jgi:hypothetical protein
MNISDLENLDRDFLTAAQIAPILGTDPNLIRYQAHNAPQKLGFPVIVIGTRVKIPREGFINFCKGSNAAD